MNALWARIKREPVILLGFVGAVILIAVNFGVSISDTQIDSIVNVISTFVVLMGGASVARRSTVPYQDVIAYRAADGEPTVGPSVDPI